MKEKSAFSLYDHATKIESVLLALLFLLLPTQLGKHFWPQFSLVEGIRVDYLSPTLYVTDLLSGLLFFFFILRFGRSLFVFFLGNAKRVIVSVVIISFLLLNVLHAERVSVSLYYLIKLLEFSFIGLYIAINIQRQTQLSLLALLFVVSTFFQSLLAILQYLQQGSLNGWLYFFGERMFTGSTPGIANAAINGELILRPYGTFPHPNVLAGYLLLSLIIIYFFLVRRARGFIRAFSIFVLCFSSLALLLSLSRVVIGLWVLFLASVLFYQVFVRLRTVHTIVIGLMFLILGVIFVIFSPLGQTLSSRFFQTSLLEESLVQRTELVHHSLAIIQNNFVLGVGMGNFIPALSPLQDPLSIGLYLQPVHNIYLLLTAETGLIGLMGFLLFLFVTYRHLVLQIRQTPLFRTEFLVTTLLLSTILMIGFFDHYFISLQQGQLLFAAILGLCWIKLRD